MNTLDSRVLSSFNCFAQKFANPGRVVYRLTTAAGACLPLGDDEDTFVIEVGKKTRRPSEQHNVTVRRDEGGALVAEPKLLQIEAGDMVLWHAADRKTPAFTLQGEGADMRFDSGMMQREAVYSHAFGLPGTYEWVDANGSDVRGVVEVVSPDARSREACNHWLKDLAKGTLVHIVDGKPKPAHVKIVAGQTVFWAVESAPGISITDARLVQRAKPRPAPKPAASNGKKPRARKGTKEKAK